MHGAAKFVDGTGKRPGVGQVPSQVQRRNIGLVGPLGLVDVEAEDVVLGAIRLDEWCVVSKAQIALEPDLFCPWPSFPS